MTVVEILLGIAAAFGLAGYIRTAYDDFGARELMPGLLIALILALGFLGLLLK